MSWHPRERYCAIDGNREDEVNLMDFCETHGLDLPCTKCMKERIEETEYLNAIERNLNTERVECMDKKIEEHLRKQESILFEYCGKEFAVKANTTLAELQEAFGHEMDVLDLFSANWRIA